jgi:hypothetical protein
MSATFLETNIYLYKVRKGKGMGKGRLPIGQYHAELLLMGCMAWFDNKRRHFLTWVKNLLK